MLTTKTDSKQMVYNCSFSICITFSKPEFSLGLPNKNAKQQFRFFFSHLMNYLKCFPYCSRNWLLGVYLGGSVSQPAINNFLCVYEGGWYCSLSAYACILHWVPIQVLAILLPIQLPANVSWEGDGWRLKWLDSAIPLEGQDGAPEPWTASGPYLAFWAYGEWNSQWQILSFILPQINENKSRTLFKAT